MKKNPTHFSKLRGLWLKKGTFSDPRSLEKKGIILDSRPDHTFPRFGTCVLLNQLY